MNITWYIYLANKRVIRVWIIITIYKINYNSFLKEIESESPLKNPKPSNIS